MKRSIVIVEDEPRIVEGLCYIIQKDFAEVEVLGVAYDGQKGYDLIMQHMPDIVLADIRMPKLNGLDMISKLKEAECSSKFIILTSYAEFEYAKKAISLGVRNYITKPVDKEELFCVIREICHEIEKEHDIQQNVGEVMGNYGVDMKELLFRQYLEASTSNKTKLAFLLKQMGLKLKCKRYCCAIFEINSEQEVWDIEKIKQKISANCLKYEEVIILRYASNQALIIVGDKNITDKTFYNILMKSKFDLVEEYGFSLNIGMGSSHDVGDISLSLKEAKCALQYKVVKGSDVVIVYKDISEIKEDGKMILTEELKRLETCMESMDMSGCRVVVQEIFQRLEKESELSIETLQNISLNIILLSIRKMPYIQFNISEYLGKDIFTLENVTKFCSIDQLKNVVINALQGMNDLIIRENMPEKRDIVEEAKKFMKKNFSRNISLNDISENFFINPYYFSQLFKQKTGVNYQTYLTELRINRAKKLLKETDMKIYDVCEMVGYSNVNHFNKMFEKMVGFKPREYRDRCREGMVD